MVFLAKSKLQFDLFFKNFPIYKHIRVYRLKRLEVLIQICDMFTFAEFNLGEMISDASIVDTLFDMSIKMENSMRDCEWRSERIACRNLFRPILTEDGFCFIFNSLNSRDIYTDE